MRRILTLLLLLAPMLLPARGQRATVAVVVDPATYAAIPADVDAFVASMQDVGKEGLLLVDRWGHPDSLRAALRQLYDRRQLEGAVLVGEIPIPMIRDAHHMTTAFKMSPKQP